MSPNNLPGLPKFGPTFNSPEADEPDEVEKAYHIYDALKSNGEQITGMEVDDYELERSVIDSNEYTQNFLLREASFLLPSQPSNIARKVYISSKNYILCFNDAKTPDGQPLEKSSGYTTRNGVRRYLKKNMPLPPNDCGHEYLKSKIELKRLILDARETGDYSEVRRLRPFWGANTNINPDVDTIKMKELEEEDRLKRLGKNDRLNAVNGHVHSKTSHPANNLSIGQMKSGVHSDVEEMKSENSLIRERKNLKKMYRMTLKSKFSFEHARKHWMYLGMFRIWNKTQSKKAEGIVKTIVEKEAANNKSGEILYQQRLDELKELKAIESKKDETSLKKITENLLGTNSDIILLWKTMSDIDMTLEEKRARIGSIYFCPPNMTKSALECLVVGSVEGFLGKNKGPSYNLPKRSQIDFLLREFGFRSLSEFEDDICEGTKLKNQKETLENARKGISLKTRASREVDILKSTGIDSTILDTEIPEYIGKRDSPAQNSSKFNPHQSNALAELEPLIKGRKTVLSYYPFKHPLTYTYKVLFDFYLAVHGSVLPFGKSMPSFSWIYIFSILIDPNDTLCLKMNPNNYTYKIGSLKILDKTAFMKSNNIPSISKLYSATLASTDSNSIQSIIGSLMLKFSQLESQYQKVCRETDTVEDATNELKLAGEALETHLKANHLEDDIVLSNQISEARELIRRTVDTKDTEKTIEYSLRLFGVKYDKNQETLAHYEELFRPEMARLCAEIIKRSLTNPTLPGSVDNNWFVCSVERALRTESGALYSMLSLIDSEPFLKSISMFFVDEDHARRCFEYLKFFKTKIRDRVLHSGQGAYRNSIYRGNEHSTLDEDLRVYREGLDQVQNRWLSKVSNTLKEASEIDNELQRQKTNVAAYKYDEDLVDQVKVFLQSELPSKMKFAAEKLIEAIKGGFLTFTFSMGTKFLIRAALDSDEFCLFFRKFLGNSLTITATKRSNKIRMDSICEEVLSIMEQLWSLMREFIKDDDLSILQISSSIFCPISRPGSMDTFVNNAIKAIKSAINSMVGEEFNFERRKFARVRDILDSIYETYNVLFSQDIRSLISESSETPARKTPNATIDKLPFDDELDLRSSPYVPKSRFPDFPTNPELKKLIGDVLRNQNPIPKHEDQIPTLKDLFDGNSGIRFSNIFNAVQGVDQTAPAQGTGQTTTAQGTGQTTTAQGTGQTTTDQGTGTTAIDPNILRRQNDPPQN